jgi:hypothetical protein
MKLHLAAAGSAVLVISGCGLPPSVKEATSDKYAFVAKNFSTASIPAAVRDAVVRADAGPLPFKKMTLKVAVTQSFYQGTGTPPAREVGITYIAAGGPFIQRIDEVFSNGIETQQYYSLTYRGFLALRSDGLNVNAAQGSFFMEIRSLASFQPLPLTSAGGGDLNYAYAWGTPVQLINLKDYQYHCSPGALYSASKINVKFSGEAQDLSCELDGGAGQISQTRGEQVLLFDYGVTVPKSGDTASGTVTYTISSVAIE